MLKGKDNKKRIIRIKRLISLYFLRIINVIQILILFILFILLFSNYFNNLTFKLFSCFIDVTNQAGLILKHLIIAGQVNTNDNDILEAIDTKTEYRIPIYLVNIEDIRKRIESNPWIKIALVQRRLPDTLFVVVVEKKPIAIWQFEQALYLIDEEGTKISSKNIENFKHLLHVVGQGANVHAGNLCKNLDRHPSLAKKVVSAVRYGQRRWDLNLEQKINIKMPEKSFEDAYDYLYLLDKNNKLFDQNYKVINLKDKNKYYIEKY